jgi:hypothetical protein
MFSLDFSRERKQKIQSGGDRRTPNKKHPKRRRPPHFQGTLLRGKQLSAQKPDDTTG